MCICDLLNISRSYAVNNVNDSHEFFSDIFLSLSQEELNLCHFW